MKKTIPLILLSILLFSCNQNNDSISKLENEVSQLKQKLDNVYKPGFGEIMGNIQHHHSKLWFAGKNENWDLAEFELHEISEGFDDLEKYQSIREESKFAAMIKPALNSVGKAVKENNLGEFKNNFILFTNTCNACHEKTNYEFIKIKVPDFQPYSNQVFKIK